VTSLFPVAADPRGAVNQIDTWVAEANGEFSFALAPLPWSTYHPGHARSAYRRSEGIGRERGQMRPAALTGGSKSRRGLTPPERTNVSYAPLL